MPPHELFTISAQPEAKTRCAVCGAPALGTFWDHYLCERHSSQWFSDKAFDAAALGLSPETSIEEACARYRNAVAAWVYLLKAREAAK